MSAIASPSICIPENLIDHNDIVRHLWEIPCTTVREREYKRLFDVYEGAPNAWSAERGATHTLWLGSGPGRGYRPAILKKTVLLVGDDEADDKIVWKKWNVKAILFS